MPANPATSTAKSSSCRKPIQVLVVHTVAATHCRTTAAAQRRSLSSPRLTKTDMLRHRVAVPVSPTPALRDDSDARMCRTGGRSDHDHQSAWQLHRGHRCAARTSGQITWPSQRLPPRTGWTIHRRLPDRERARPQKGPEHDNVCDNGSASELAANSRAAKAPSLSRFHAVDE